MKKDKPPLGVIPKFIMMLTRLDDIKAAIDRYSKVNKPIPIEWIIEYNELVRSL